jgi:hypothetical protein
MFSILRGHHNLTRIPDEYFCMGSVLKISKNRQRLLSERYLTGILDNWGRAQLVEEMRHKTEGSGLDSGWVLRKF